VKIVDVRTTVLRQPGVPGIQDATIRHRDTGRSALFVHILTDDGIEGLGVGTAVARGIVENSLKPLLLEQDPLCHEKLWDDMFWRVRGYGRKGVAFCAISTVDIALWDLKAKLFGMPLYRLRRRYRSARRRSCRRRHRVAQGRPPGVRIQSTRRAARGAVRPPAPRVLYAEPQVSGVSRRIRGRRSRVVHGVSGTARWVLVSVS
jgi:Mandelate racemase / muconate lactonizing enzyme, N-terminal domain